MRLVGIEVSPADIRWLVSRLYQDAHASAVGVALRLEKALALETRILGVSTVERNTILGVLDDPPRLARSPSYAARSRRTTPSAASDVALVGF